MEEKSETPTDRAGRRSGRKQLLDVEGQIASLRDRGVRFVRCKEADAGRYLSEISNLLHVSAYRSLFQRHSDGPSAGKFVDLDFADLVALDCLDCKLRSAFMDATLVVEARARTRLLLRMTQVGEDGYSVVSEFLASLDPSFRRGLMRELDRRRDGHDCYTGDLIDKYYEDMPAWVLVEVIPFGALLSFYRFCALRWDDRAMLDEHYLLKQAKALRNACAHGSCIVDGFRPGVVSSVRTSLLVLSALTSSGISNSKSRRAKLSNPRMQQLVTTLYVLHMFARGTAPREVGDALRSLSAELRATAEGYGPQNPFVSYLSFLARVIDLWFPQVAK